MSSPNPSNTVPPPAGPGAGWPPGPPPGAGWAPTDPPPGAGSAPAGRRGRGRRLALLTVAAGLVGLLAAGGGTYAAVHSAKSGVGPDKCGRIRCIPNLKAEKVVNVLKQQGHNCQHKDGWECTLTTGVVEYTANVREQNGLVHEVWVQVLRPDDTEPTPAMTDYLFWFASLPFGDDPAFLQELKSWLEGRIKAGKNAQARIGGYRYDLEVVKGLRLYIQGA